VLGPESGAKAIAAARKQANHERETDVHTGMRRGVQCLDQGYARLKRLLETGTAS
jgi:hypothetical protein